MTVSGRINSYNQKFKSSPLMQYGLLVVITLLAALLRFYKLGEWGFWIDEIFTINRASQHVNLATIIAQWWHPSVSLILTDGALETLGISEWNARLIPAIIGTVSIPLLFFPIRQLFGRSVALVAMLLLAVSPWHLEWSQNARSYTSLLVFYFFAAYVFFRVIEFNKPWHLILSGVLLVLAIGERFVAAFLVPVTLIYLVALYFFQDKWPQGLKRNSIIILIPLICFGVIEAVRFITTGGSYLTGALELTYSLPIDDPFRLGTLIAYDIGIPLLCLGVFSSIYLLHQKSRIGLFVSLNAVIPVVILLIVNPFYFTQDRYVFVVLPFWLILAAVGVKELYSMAKGNRKVVAIGVLALLIADAAGDNLLYYQVNNGNRHDWKGAFTLVKEKSLPGDQFVSWWPQFGPYYLDQEIISWGDIDPEYVEDSGKRFWIVLDEETIWGNKPMKAWIEKNGELIDINYLRRPNEVSLFIYLYDPRR